MMAGRLEEAEQSMRSAVRLSPGGSGAHFYLGAILLLQGRHEEALQEVELETRPGYRHTGRALIYETMGDSVRASEELDKVIEIGDRWTYQIAAVHAYFNEPDEAIYWLERAIDRSDTSLGQISNDPFMDNIRDDPRFVEIEKIVTGGN
jgi:tetratricopeptide (TPR) repeat protein